MLWEPFASNVSNSNLTFETHCGFRFEWKTFVSAVGTHGTSLPPPSAAQRAAHLQRQCWHNTYSKRWLDPGVFSLDFSQSKHPISLLRFFTPLICKASQVFTVKRLWVHEVRTSYFALGSSVEVSHIFPCMHPPGFSSRMKKNQPDKLRHFRQRKLLCISVFLARSEKIGYKTNKSAKMNLKSSVSGSRLQKCLIIN